MTKLSSKLTLTLIAGVALGASLLSFTINNTQENQNFKTQSNTTEEFLFFCNQTITYDDRTRETTIFYSADNNTSQRQCIDNEKCQGLFEITTSCKERN